MSTDNPASDDPPDQAQPAAEQDLETADDTAGRDGELHDPTEELAQHIADAVGPIQDLVRHQLDAHRPALDALNSTWLRYAADVAARQSRLVTELTQSSAFSAQQRQVEEIAAGLVGFRQRFYDQNAWMLQETREALQHATQQVIPWLTEFARWASELSAAFRAAMPPNWQENDTIPPAKYAGAVALILEEGIPLAWVPDCGTLGMLMAIEPGPDRSTALRTVLADRTDIVLAHCDRQLDALIADPDTTQHCLQSVEVARQAIQALRAGLPAPAQSAAANLADHLLRRLPFDDSHYTYRKAKKQIVMLSDNHDDLPLIAVLREFSTLMAVPKALTEWWPGDPLPDSFSRHTTAHAITEPDQINPINALIAVMLAVSLLCQESTSGWEGLSTFVWNAQTEDTTPKSATG